MSRVKGSRWTIEELKEAFKDKGMELLEDEFRGVDKKYRAICVCGREYTPNAGSVLKGHQCLGCRKDKRTKKFKLSHVKKEMERLGYKVLDDEYHGSHTPMKVLCPQCGKEDYKSLDNARRKQICKKCAHENNSGERNPAWRFDITQEEREQQREGAEHREWRVKVFERDNYTCQLCFSHGSSLEAHHIAPFSLNRKKRTDIENGATLCKPCHAALHKNFKLENMNLHTFSVYKNNQTSLGNKTHLKENLKIGSSFEEHKDSLYFLNGVNDIMRPYLNNKSLRVYSYYFKGDEWVALINTQQDTVLEVRNTLPPQYM